MNFPPFSREAVAEVFKRLETMIINAKLREFLHRNGALERFIENAEQQNNYPEIIQSVIGSFRWSETEEKKMFWFRLHLMWERLKRRPQGLVNYYGDDDSRAE